MSLNEAETGTVRFGLFGAAHLYVSGDLVCRTLDQHPGVNVALVGQNSSEVIEDIRAGNLEAGLVALPIHNEERLHIEPVARDELVYLSADPQRVMRPATPSVISAAKLVLPEVTWGDKDFTRQQLKRTVQAASLPLQPRVEVENVETAIEIAAQGYADTIAARGVVRRVAPKLGNKLYAVELAPRLYEEFAIVYRTNTHLSRATRTVIERAKDLLMEATAT
ncbi:LysR family transcriptional regulator substrate-binding protein [Glutamicibacter sp. JL.03c]|uniref:LysR family transcriptional regulator substrate-binding protein n=1 Tax=Glutamicibacter sp. JL.03c TaxID=2984842 RepID=UPI0021F7ABA2|nr:LysR family transcriptional regulator substrate-binding protein [Glutamicibacter sp. JL.03c]UYQ78874.1 LysR family transcriptional regulator substrate-binding protein [Glutamicibacter sp. JL.03c]